jgi:hypothetical protein
MWRWRQRADDRRLRMRVATKRVEGEVALTGWGIVTPGLPLSEGEAAVRVRPGDDHG